jgi:hypothetical protein
MGLLQQLAEARIREAIEAGELDNLAGRGRPLQLDDDRLVPEGLRAGYRLLKNAGYLPPELVLRREIADVRELLAAARCESDRGRAERRLDALLLRLAHSRGRGPGAGLEIYRDQILRQRGQAAVPELPEEPGSGSETPNSPAR